MDLSLYLARAWGLLSILISIALLLNQRRFINQLKTVSEDYVIGLVAGVIALVIGAAQVAGYNSWTLDYRGLITVFGWIALLKGVAITAAPTRYLALIAGLIARGSWYRVALVLLLIAGVYLLYTGLAFST